MNNKLNIAALATLAVIASANLPSFANRAQFDANHPRRAEVLHRDGNLNRRINNNKGNLDGHYGQLKRQDNRIRNQEQRDAGMNGGHITKGEQQQINHEENHVNQEIKHDR